MAKNDVSARTDLTGCAEKLRLALPLMTRYGIPPTPENYAVWYHYVLDDKPLLKDLIDGLLDKED